MLSTSAHRIVIALASLAAISLVLAGCAQAGPVAGLWPVALLLSALSMVGLAACGRASAPTDAAVDGAASWEACCEDGVLTTCYCPAGWACNYSRGLRACGDGTCVYNENYQDTTPCDPWDDGPPDMGMDAGEDMSTDAAVDGSTP